MKTQALPFSLTTIVSEIRFMSLFWNLKVLTLSLSTFAIRMVVSLVEWRSLAELGEDQTQQNMKNKSVSVSIMKYYLTKSAQ